MVLFRSEISKFLSVLVRAGPRFLKFSRFQISDLLVLVQFGPETRTELLLPGPIGLVRESLIVF